MDDLWISAILKHREKVPLILLGGNKSGLDPPTPKWKQTQKRRPLLVEVQHKGWKDASCIVASKKLLHDI